MIPLVDLKAQYKGIKKEIDGAIAQVINSADFILGEEVSKFEEEYAKYCGVKYAVGLDSGISALELGMRAIGLGTGDEVLTPANSFIASSSAISFTGATPVLIDCDPRTYNIDLNDAERKLTQKTKAIMPVHLYGQMADMEEVMKFAKKHSLFVIEDACQAHGAKYKGKRAGSFGDFAAFSFYPGKNLGAYGDGGILTTNNKKIYEAVKMMRNYGQKEKYHHLFLAWNRRLDTIQAAVLRVKLKYLDNWNLQRRENAKFYTSLLKELDVVTPYEASHGDHVYHLYVIRVKNRDKLKEFLYQKGIGVGIHYPLPIHLQPVYKDLGYGKGDFPISEKFANEIISLPMYAELSKKQIKYTVAKIKSFLKSQ